MSRLRGGGAGLAVLVVLAAVVLWSQAMRVHVFAPDEEYYVDLARVFAEGLPGSVWDVPEVSDFNDRGLQRLLVWLLAVPVAALGGDLGFGLARALLCLAFASAAVPAYLLARGVRLTAGWALGAAALTVAVPWAVLTSSLLTESLAYPLGLWIVWAAWRACLVPGVRSDLLALGLVALGGLARTSLLALVVVAPVAVALHTAARVGLRRAPRVIAREHPLIALALGGGALALLLGAVGRSPLGGLSGSYATSVTAVDWDPLPARFAGQLARIATGVGVLPAVLGSAWAVDHALRRRTPETHALASCAVVVAPVLVLSTIYAAPEERYLMLVAPVLVVCGVAALARRDVAPWAVGAAGVLVAGLVWRVPWPFVDDLGRFQVDPAQSFLTRAVLTRLPIGLLAAAILAAGALLALLVSRRPAPARAAGAAAASLLALVGLQLVQTGYVVTKRAATTEGAAGFGERAWVDARAGGSGVTILADGLGDTLVYEPVWREVAFFNRRVDRIAATDGRPDFLVPRHAEVAELDVDPRTGALALPGRAGIGRLWLVPSLFQRLGLASELVDTAGYLPAALVRLRGAPRATFAWDGTDVEGYLLADGRPATLRLFPAAAPCVTVLLQGPPEFAGRHAFAITGPGVRRVGAVRTGERAEVTIPVRGGPRTLTVRGSGSVQIASGRAVSLQIALTAAGRDCARA